MSSKLNYKQVANVERRTWDEEEYAAKARERAEREKRSKNKSAGKKRPLPSEIEAGDERTTSDTKPSTTILDELKEEVVPEEFQSAEKGAAGPLHSKRAFLKARRQQLNLDAKVGSSEIVNPDLAAASSLKDNDGVSITDGVTKSDSGVGWYCRVCDCFLKDSLTYLDHINGRKHQRALGYSMRIEKSTTDQVAGKLEALAKKRQADREEQEKEQSSGFEVGEDEEGFNIFDNMVKQKDEDLKRRKAERKKRREERKRRERENKDQKQTAKEEANGSDVQKVGENDGNRQEEDEIEEEAVHPDMAALMGFSSFG